MAILSLQIDPEDLRLMQETLSPKQFRSAMYQATKRTTNSLRTRIGREIRKQSYANREHVDRAVVTVLPRSKDDDMPVGEVRIKQIKLPLIAFRTRASKTRGVTATYGPGQAPVTLRHAFKTTVGSHEGIFMRGRKLPSKGPNVGKGKLTRRGYAGRFTIIEVAGPSIYSLMNVQEVVDSIVFDTSAVMAKNLSSQFDRFTKPKTPPPIQSA